MINLQNFNIFLPSSGGRRLAATAWRIGSTITYSADDLPIRKILGELLDNNFDHLIGFPGERIEAQRGTREAFEATARLLKSMGFEATAIQETRPTFTSLEFRPEPRLGTGTAIDLLSPEYKIEFKGSYEGTFGETAAAYTGSILPRMSFTMSAGNLETLNERLARAA